MHHIFVDENLIDLSAKRIVIKRDYDSENYDHLVKSLRINTNEKVLCSVNSFSFSFDYLTIVNGITKDEIELSILEETKPNELGTRINLYQGISKSDKMEFIIEKAVELGAYSITPFTSKYCIAKIESDKASKKLLRYNKISKSAAEQSKRHIIPAVNEPLSFKEVMNQIKDRDGALNILFYENANGIINTKKAFSDKNYKEINIIIGPEGGFSNEEIDFAVNSKVNILSLGERILRTETAAVTALSIAMYEMENNT